MRISSFLLLALLLLFSLSSASSKQDKYALFSNEWCGDENCYEIMGVKPSAERSQIKQVYKNASRDLHPDKHPNQTESDRQLYLKIVRAHDILADPVKREQYDDYLRLKASIDSPRESAIVVFLLLYAAVAYVVLQYKTQAYNTIRKNILGNGKVQRQLLDLYNIDLTGRNTKTSSKAKKKKKGRKKASAGTPNGSDDESETEAKKPEDLVTNEQIDAALKAEHMVVPGWTGEKPDFKMAAQSIPKFIVWGGYEVYFQIRWQIRYTLLKKKYTDADREYLCRVLHKYDEDSWKKLSDQQRTAMLRGNGPWRKGQKKSD